MRKVAFKIYVWSFQFKIKNTYKTFIEDTTYKEYTLKIPYL